MLHIDHIVVPHNPRTMRMILVSRTSGPVCVKVLIVSSASDPQYLLAPLLQTLLIAVLQIHTNGRMLIAMPLTQVFIDQSFLHSFELAS